MPGRRDILPSRRDALAAFGALAAGVAGPAGMLVAEQGYQQRSADIRVNRRALGQRNLSLCQRKFSIRIVNDHFSPVVLGLFGMHGRNLRSGMQYRAIVSGNGGTHNAPRDIDGGDRLAIVWDTYSGAVVDFAHTLVDRDGFVQWQDAFPALRDFTEGVYADSLPLDTRREALRKFGQTTQTPYAFYLPGR